MVTTRACWVGTCCCSSFLFIIGNMQATFDMLIEFLFSQNPEVRVIEFWMLGLMTASVPLVVWMHLENKRLKNGRR